MGDILKAVWNDIQERKSVQDSGPLCGFSVTCKRCGGSDITLQDTRNWSAKTGYSGACRLICGHCGNATAICLE